MAGFGSIMGGAASGIGAITEGISTFFGNARQKRMIDYQYRKQSQFQRAEDAFNWQKYNSPSAQKAAYRAAGINPFAAGQQVGGAQVDTGSAPGMVDAKNPFEGFSSNIQAGASSFFQLQNMQKQNELLDAEANYYESQARNIDNKTDEDQTSFQTRLDTLQQALDKLKSEASIAAFNDSRKEIVAAFQDAQNQLQIDEVVQRIDNLVKQGNLTDEQIKDLQELRETKIEEAKSRIRENDASARERDAAAEEHRSAAAFNWARATTEDFLRQARYDNLIFDTNLKAAEAALKAADKLLREQQVKSQEIENELNEWIKEQKINRRPTEDYYTMAKEVVDRWLVYRGQNIERDKQRSSNRNSLIGIALRAIMAKFLK